MSWNFRVIRDETPQGTRLRIAEVYGDGERVSAYSDYAAGDIAVEGAPILDDLRWMLAAMTRALDKPILDMADPDSWRYVHDEEPPAET